MNDGPPILIFGFTNIGVDVARHLNERDQPFVIADNQTERCDFAADLGYNVHQINITDDSQLRAIGVGTSIRTVFCLMTNDAENVFLTISAHAIDHSVNIISLCSSHNAASKLLAAGANKIINPFQISGRRIYEMIHRPQAVTLMDEVVFGRTDLHVVQITICQTSSLNGIHLAELKLSEHFNLVLMGVEDRELSNQFIFATENYNHKLDAGDKLVVVGPAAEIARFKKETGNEPR